MLDANAADAVDVEAWLEGDDVASQERLCGAAYEVGILGMREAESMACVMREGIGDTGFLEDAADGVVDGEAFCLGA